MLYVAHEIGAGGLRHDGLYQYADDAPASKTDAERLLLVSPELAEVLTAIIFRVRAGKASLPLVSAYDVFEQTWSPPMPYLFQRRFGTEDRPLTRSYIRECLVATSNAAQIAAGGRPLQWRPHDFRRIFVTDAIRSGSRLECYFNDPQEGWTKTAAVRNITANPRCSLLIDQEHAVEAIDWPTLGLLAGMFSLVPIFGTIISSLPIVMLCLPLGGVSLYGGSGSAIGAIFGALMFRTIGDLLFVFDLEPLWQPLFQGVVLLGAVSLGAARVFRVKNRLELFN